MQFEGSPDDSEESRIYTVTDITDDKVVVDGNHPLAGRSLLFACTVTAVRPPAAKSSRTVTCMARKGIITDWLCGARQPAVSRRACR